MRNFSNKFARAASLGKADRQRQARDVPGRAGKRGAGGVAA
jgi:hypothetical protein